MNLDFNGTEQVVLGRLTQANSSPLLFVRRDDYMKILHEGEFRPQREMIFFNSKGEELTPFYCYAVPTIVWEFFTSKPKHGLKAFSEVEIPKEYTCAYSLNFEDTSEFVLRAVHTPDIPILHEGIKPLQASIEAGNGHLYTDVPCTWETIFFTEPVARVDYRFVDNPSERWSREEWLVADGDDTKAFSGGNGERYVVVDLPQLGWMIPEWIDTYLSYKNSKQ
jgi:hypothetical protein